MIKFYFKSFVFIFAFILQTLTTSAQNACTPSPVKTSNDVAICKGASVNLATTGGSSTFGYNWDADPSLSATNIPNPVATPLVTTTYRVSSQFRTGPNLVTNGDFSAGNTGFNSSYKYIGNSGTNSDQGGYSVRKDPYTHNNGFSKCTDHTSGNGNMMIMDGSCGTNGVAANANFWCQTITVAPNTNYVFSAWLTNVYPNNVSSTLLFSINGQPLGNPSVTSFTTCVWQEFYVIWNSGTNTSVNICIAEGTGVCQGNDFAVDDISFYELCTASDDVTVTVSDIQNTITSISNVTCTGSNTGIAKVVPINGVAPYTYTWSNGSTTDSVSNLSQGNHIVTVGDAAGCTKQASVTITQPSQPLSVNIVPSSIVNNCNLGGVLGQVSLNAIGGVPPYLYRVSGGVYQSSPNFTGLAAGTYTAEVLDDAGCLKTAAFTIAQPSQNLSAVVNPADITHICVIGQATGSALVTATGGYPAYSYSLNGGAPQASNSFTGLAAGNYTVDILDTNGCTTQTTFTIQDPASGQNLSAVVNPADITHICVIGQATGSALVTATGGYPAYSYNLNGGTPQASNSFTGLAAGNYTVDILDTNGCTTQTTFVIQNPASGQNLAAIVNPADITHICVIGQATGSALVTATGGYPAYSYSLNGGTPQASNSFTGLAAGNYTVDILDTNGCTTQTTFTIQDPASGQNLSAVVNPADITHICVIGQATGSALVTATGGYPAYSYSLNGGTPQASNSFTGLAAGTYTVDVLDTNGCTTQTTFVIQNPASGQNLAAIVNPADITHICVIGQATGSALVIATGGYPAYSYSLNGGTPQASNSFTGLAAGTYTVDILDTNGCTTQTTFTIQDPASGQNLAAVVNPADITHICVIGQATGSALVTATGGYPAYSYSLNGGTPQASNSFTGLAAGTYTVDVLDTNGCTIQTNFTINDPVSNNNLSATVNPADITHICVIGQATGSALVTTTGGYPAYSYSLNDGTPQASNSFTGLAAGTYTVDVLDTNGCTTQTTFVIQNPASGQNLAAIVNPADITHICVIGQATGSALVIATGGYPAYSYSLNGGAPQASNSFTGLAAGNYTVDILDTNGCTTQTTFVIQNPASGQNLAAVVNPADITHICVIGQATGSALVTATGGYPAYSYSLNGGTPQASNSFTGLAAGTYTVDVLDTNGCTTQTTFTIQDPASGQNLSAVVNPADITHICVIGQATGSALVIATGGYPAYSYSLNGGTPQASNSFTGLAAGTYTVDILDTNGCTTQTTFTIQDPASGQNLSAVVNPADITHICVIGQATGSALVTATGGYPAYSYSLNGGTPQASNSFTGLAAGNYTVDILDTNGCTTQTTFTIQDPASGQNLSAVVNPADITHICVIGQATGSALVTATGGYPAYSYSLNGGAPQALNSFTGLAAGTYTVDILDTNGCTIQTNFTINDPISNSNLAATVNPADITHICVIGQATGSALVTATGGYPAYSYSLNGGAPQASNSFTGLTAGTYTVDILDTNGCTTQTTFVIQNPASGQNLAAVVNPADITHICVIGQATGSALVTATGGYPAYSYSLNGGTPQASNSFTGLAAGTYTVDVLDTNGCTTQTTFTIQDPASGQNLSAVVNPADITHICVIGQATGSALVTTTGGYPAYSYSLNGGTPQASNSFTGLAAGNYTVDILDTNGCTIQTNFTINDPISNSNLAATVNPADITHICVIGQATGSALVTATGGYPAYSYSLNGGTPQASNSFTGLAAGNYTVDILDTNGCTTQTTFTIQDPASGQNLSAVVNPADITHICVIGQATGSALVTATGGYPAYSYSLNGGAPQALNSFTGLAAGTYTVDILDTNGCTTQTTFTIQDPASGQNLAAVVNPADITHICVIGQATGSALVTATGGYPAYSYSLNGGTPQASNSFTGLAADNYTVDILDTNGCTTQTTFTIQDPASGQNLSAVVNPADITHICVIGQATGSALVTATGGYPAYSYSLNGGTPQASNSFTGLAAGAYTVDILDTNGCTTQTTFVIQNPASGQNLSAVVNPADITHICVIGQATGSALVTATGGYPAYSYSLNGGTPQASNSFTGLAAGTYTVDILDTNGCTTQTTFTIQDPASGQNLSAVVNPADITHICVIGQATGSALVTATGGYPAYSYSLNGGTPQASNSFTGLAAGTYTVDVLDTNGCTIQTNFTINDPVSNNNLAATVNPADITHICVIGQATGSALVTTTGGYPAYSYSLNGGTPQASNSFTGLAAGTYMVDILDTNGCTTQTTFVIQNPASGQNLAAIVNPADITHICVIGQATGSALVTATGGYPAYSYSLNGGTPQTSNSFTGLAAGTYTVDILDTNGCTTQTTFTIQDPASGQNLSAVVNPADITHICVIGQTTGSAIVTATGGYPAYSYSLNGGTPQASNSFTGLAAGNYTVDILDTNGCTTQTTFTIQDPASGQNLSAVVNPADITHICVIGQATGSALVTATGGYPAYSYSLNGGAPQALNSFTGLAAGTYTVDILDTNGCTTQTTFTIQDPASGQNLSAVVNPADITHICVIGQATGSALVTATGGYPAYSYSLNGGTPQASNSFTGLAAGAYTVDILDTNGCTTQTTFVIQNPASGQNLSAVVNPADITHICVIGQATGSALVTATGGYPAYSYSLNGGTPQASNSFTGLAAGNYTVDILETNGCTTQTTFVIQNPASGQNLAAIVNPADITHICVIGQATGSALVTATGGYPAYSYSLNGAPSDGSNSYVNLPAGSYVVTVSDENGCLAQTSFTIHNPLNGNLTLNSTINHVSCEGEEDASIDISIGGGYPVYDISWGHNTNTNSPVVNNLAPGTYNVSILDTNGCSITGTYVITEPDALSAVLINQIDVSCFGGNNGSITTQVSGGTAPYLYAWNHDNTLNNSNAVNLYAGNYGVVITDANGCITTLASEVKQPDLLVVNATASSFSGCFNDDIFLEANVSGGVPGYLYLWSNGKTSQSQTIELVTTSNYQVVVTDANGCKATLSAAVNITLNPSPNASFGYGPNFITDNNPNVDFFNTSTGGAYYQWDFGDGVSSTNFSPSHMYALEANLYESVLIVTNEFGCKDTANAEIIIVPDFAVYIPNSFTPNGDKLNAVFRAVGRGYKWSTMVIANRWGNEIIKLEGDQPFTIGWDGTFNDQECQVGTYAYKFEVIDLNNKKHTYFGHINLIR